MNNEETNYQRIDRRINRTLRQLREALFGLMLEKPYESITIEDITRRADLGRTTFYLHFKDKEELLLESIEAVAVELKEKILEAMKDQPPMLSREVTAAFAPGWRPISMVLEHAAANASLYLPILRGEGTPRAPAVLRQIIHQSAYEFFVTRIGDEVSARKPDIPIEVLTNFFTTSLLGMLTWWLENGMPYSPEVMAEMYRRLFFYGTGQMV
jgi:AcrR family transcriptional regulator